LRWSGYHSRKNERMGELGRLAAERAKPARPIDLLDPEGVDADLVDEILRTQLGLARADKVVITIR
jgi:cell division protein FtsB